MPDARYSGCADQDLRLLESKIVGASSAALCITAPTQQKASESPHARWRSELIRQRNLSLVFVIGSFQLSLLMHYLPWAFVAFEK